MSNEVSEIQGILIKDAQAREEIEELINKINNNTTIMIGDSYGEGTTAGGTITGWCDRLKNSMELSDEEYYKFVEGGVGFVQTNGNGNTFLKILQNNISQVTDKTKVKKIIVCGGYNDRNITDMNTVESAVASFISYCKTNFPNAQVYIGMIGNTSGVDITGKVFAKARCNLARYVLTGYKQCQKYGGIYLKGVENILKYYPYISNDEIHPNENGYQMLAIGIDTAIKCGNFEFATTEEVYTSSDGMVMAGQIIGDNVSLIVANDEDGPIVFNTPKQCNENLDLGTININCYREVHKDHIPNIPCHFYFTTSDDKFYGGTGFINIENGHAILHSRILKNDGIEFVRPTAKKLTIFRCGQLLPTSFC